MAAVQAVPPALIGDGTDDNLGAEALLYMIAQSIYHLLGGHARQMLANRLKTMRAEIIAQAHRMPDPDLMHKVLYEYSPALYPDRPDAPPDLPAQTTWLAGVMEYVTLRDGLDPAVLHQEGWIPVDELLRRLGWLNKEQIDEMKAAAFAEGVDYANGVKAEVKPMRAPGQDDGDDVPRLILAQFPADDTDDGQLSEFSDSSDSGDRRAPDLDVDMDSDSVHGDAGAGTGMVDLPLRAKDATKNKPDSGDQHWHSLPYESRLHTLGPGMTRAPLMPADEFALPLHPVHNPNDRVAHYKGRGVPPRYATWDEAMANAPDDYMHCPEYFAWEVEHGRAAPAVLPQDQRLPWVPFHPAIPPAPTSVYDPQLPPGPPMADDVWPSFEVGTANMAKADREKVDKAMADRTQAFKARVDKTRVDMAMTGRRLLIAQMDGAADEETDGQGGEGDEQADQAIPNGRGLLGLGWLWSKPDST